MIRQIIALSSRWRSACFSFCYIAIILFSASLSAESWEYKPRITLQGSYDDNFKLESVSHDPVFEALLRGVLSISRLSETSKVVARMHARLSDQVRYEQYFTLAAQVNRERSRWGLDGYFRQDTTIRTATIDQSLDEDAEQVIDDVDEGQLQLELRRTTARIKPKYSYFYDERTILGISYFFEDVSYKNNASGTGVFDYNQNGIASSVIYKLSERDTLSSIFSLSRFKSDGNVNTISDNFSFIVGYKRLFSERLYGNVALGLRRSNITSDNKDSNVNSFTLRMRLTRKFVNGKIRVEALKDIQPSGSGRQIETTQIKVKLNRQFKERLSGSVKLGGFERKTIGTQASDKSYYLYFVSSLNWKLSRWWSTGIGYNYRQREQIDSSNDAHSNAVLISLTYDK